MLEPVPRVTTAPGVLLVIPVRNPDPAALSDTVGAARTIRLPLVFVDDGSREPISIADIPVVRHSRERGWGQAVLTGAEMAQRQGQSHIVTVGVAHGQNLSALAGVLTAVAASPDAIIVGQRDLAMQGRSHWIRMGQRFARALFRVQTGQRVGDLGSDVCAYPVQSLIGLKLWTHGLSFAREVLVRSAWAGMALRTVDIPGGLVNTTPRASGAGRVLNTLTLLLMNVHLTMRSIVPWPHRRLVDDSDRTRLSVLHPLRSLQRLLVENASPKKIAIAVGLGVMLGTLPLFFVHTVVIIMAASFFGLNKPTAVMASQLCMPPLVPALCIEVGHRLRHGTFLTELSLRTVGYEAWDRILEWVLGSVVLAPFLAMTVGFVAYLMACGIARNLRRANASN